MVEKKQLNVRLPLETINQLNSIVNFYRNQIPIGRIPRDTVLADIIRVSHEQMKKSQAKKFEPTLEGLRETKQVDSGSAASFSVAEKIRDRRY